MTWFYDPHSSYDHNYAQGPFGAFASPPPPLPLTEPSLTFLGQPVHRPFGIPAGPLVNARFCEAAFAHGYDLVTYKTVRTRAHATHPFPNTLAVHTHGNLRPDSAPVLADDRLVAATSISNSFGVPSRDPDEWQPDMARAVAAAAPGQALVGSFQGTRAEGPRGGSEGAYVADHVTAARLTAATGARILEMNLSCPNEGTGALLCFDTPLVTRIATAVKEEIGDTPLILKLAYFTSDDALHDLLHASAGVVDAFAAINTIPASLVNADGAPALPGRGRGRAGVCGASIRWAGLDMVARIARWRADAGAEFAIVGVGGVMGVEDVAAYVGAGADAVMSATGAMISPGLGAAVRGVSWPDSRTSDAGVGP